MNVKIIIVVLLSLTALGGGWIWIKEKNPVQNSTEVVVVPAQTEPVEKVDQKRIDNKKREKAFEDYMLGKTKELPK